MDPESIFTIIFIIVVLSIPFGSGVWLWRAISKKKEIENLFSEAKYISGRVIGYTERRHDSENTRHHYAIIEYLSDQNEVVWAETEACNKDDYSIHSEVNVMYHPRDNRRVIVVLTQGILKTRFSFEKYFGLFVNFIFTFFIFASVISYGYGPHALTFLFLSYSAGFIFGAITKNKSTLEEKLRVQHSAARNKRLIAAQNKGEIPCYLKEE